MGECINLRRGGKQKVLPILNANYPANVSVEYGGSGNFKIEIETHGYPEEYTYQWFKDGSAISGATSDSISNQTASGTYYCEVTNKAGTVQSRTATLTVGTALPNYTYSGGHQLIDDGSGNWRLKLTSSGTLRFTNRGTGKNGMDVFLVGGGGGGDGGGGGGGYTNTVTGIAVENNNDYWIGVGAGGGAKGNGGTSQAFGKTASGGYTPTAHRNYLGGGNGGSGGGGLDANGGSNGSAGDTFWKYGDYPGGSGQGGTTGEFGNSSATLYGGGGGGSSDSSSTYPSGGAGGGGGGGYKISGTKGTDGLGGGGGGAITSGCVPAGGGSGIVIIRNKR